jgi:hypothetical protein
MSTPLTIGVTGHRPNRLAPHRLAALATEATHVLGQLRDALPIPPDLISSLAEGADRLVAEAAVALRIGLVCPLPFAVEEYIGDFADPASRLAFRSLLAEAKEIVVLPGRREDDASAYVAAGWWMLERSDLLVSVWDGGGSAGAGGTRYVMDRALEHGIPVLWLHATENQAPRLLRPLATEAGTKPAIPDAVLHALV